MFKQQITVDKIIAINNIILNNYNDAVLNQSLLESAVNNIYQCFDNHELYPTVIDKATQLFYSIVKNHCFVDGNKRTALQTLLLFLKLNNINIELTDDQLYDLTLNVADNTMSKEELNEYLKNKGE